MKSPVRGYHSRGDYLQDFRIHRGMTQAEMAEWLGVRPNTVARWERQDKPLPPLLALVMALEENLEETGC
jgi:DNA-binding XRE family transcriptional regulator